MKYLKIFEEFKVGTLYTAKVEDSNTSQIEIDGYPVKIINKEDKPGCQSVYVPILVLKSGTTTLEDLCFTELDEVKNHISSMIKRYENSNLNIDSFIVKKMILDLVVDTTKKDVELSDEIVDATKIHDFLDKNFNIILNAYIAITPQRYQKTINESSVRTALEKLRRECKSGDTKRCKEAILVFNDFIKDMMIFSIKDNNYKNIETWKLSYNGKKYFDLFSEFHKMIGHKYF